MDCPTREELHRLCVFGSEDAEEESLVAHVGSCEPCQAALMEFAEPLASLAQALADPTIKPESAALRDRLDGLKLQRPSPSTRDFTNHEDLKPWIEDGPSEVGRVDQYDLIRCIGRGGMGVVFEAYDNELRRTVAIKMMSPSLLIDSSYTERVLREARAVAAIDCPSVVKVYAASKVRDLPYLVMEYVEGESLQQQLDRTPNQNFEHVLDIACDLAEALVEAHAAGVVHRDIKPANVLISAKTGRAKITDFGLAIQTSENPITQTGMLLGTPVYLAPEQIDGKPADHRSDLFSLGSLLYQMCSGKPPFSEATLVGILKAITTQQLPPLAEQNPDIPVWFSDLISVLHEKELSDRIQTASELSEMLRHRSVATRFRGATQSTKAKGGRRALWFTGIVAIALAIGAMVGLGLYGYPERDEGYLAASAEELRQYLETASGDVTIRIAAGTVFDLDRIELNERSAEIVAMDGKAPVFRFADDAHEAAISCTNGRIELQGIRLESSAPDVAAASDDFGDSPMVSCENGELILTSCEIAGRYRGCILLQRSECTIHQSQLSTDYSAIELQPDNGRCSLSIFGSTIEANVAVGVESAGNIRVMDTTIRSNVGFETAYRIGLSEKVTITADDNRLECENSVVSVFGVPSFADNETELKQQLPFRWVTNEIEAKNLGLRVFSESGEERSLSVDVPF